MLIDAFDLADGVTETADVCIIGAGPAGITLAVRLARHRHLRVVVLESGGLEPSPTSQELARAETTGTPYFPVHEARIRALGGSTWSYGGIYAPLEAVTFASRPFVGDGWPFPAGALDAYLPEALAMCGTSSARLVAAEAATRERLLRAGLGPDTFEALPVSVAAPLRFGRHYRATLEAAANVTVILHAAAVGLDVEDDHVTGVRMRWARERGGRVTARSYVLAGGALENARLLLLAGLGGPATGRYFMEHPRLPSRYRVRPGATPLAGLIGPSQRDRHPATRLALAPDRQRAEGLLSYHAYLRFGFVGERDPAWWAARRMLLSLRAPWRDSPYLQDAGGGRMALHAADVAAVLRRPHRALVGALGALTGWPALRRFVEIIGNVEQVPEAANRVKLQRTTDALGVPTIRLLWRVGEAEKTTYERATAALLGQLDRLEPGLSGRGLDDTPPWPGGILGTWHHMGTTRMHHDPSRGVVDADCRLHGSPSVYVAGSSVFPVSGSTAPTLPIVQLALRLADHLAGELDRPAPSVAHNLR